MSLGPVDVARTPEPSPDAVTGDCRCCGEGCGRRLTDMAYNNVATLSRWLHSFDLVGLGESLGEQLADELCHGDRRAQVTLEHADLAVILGAAAQRGVGRFIASAETRAAVEGLDSDDATAALDAALATVRTALDLICVDPETADAPARARMATTGVHLLGQLVNRWDAG